MDTTGMGNTADKRNTNIKNMGSIRNDMKKLLFIALLFLSFAGYSQNEIQRATSSTTVVDDRLRARKNFVEPSFSDTSAANSAGGLDSCGSKIFTYSGSVNQEWVRMCSPKRWVQLLTSIDATSYTDSISAHNLRILKNVDSINSHNLRIFKNTDSVNSHNLRILKNTDSINAHNLRILKNTDSSNAQNLRILLNTDSSNAQNLRILRKADTSEVKVNTQSGYTVIPMHYGILRGRGALTAESYGTQVYTVASSAALGASSITLTANSSNNGYALITGQLIVYMGTDSNYYTASIASIAGAVITLNSTLEAAVATGTNVYNFYVNSYHPTVSGFNAITDYMLNTVKTQYFVETRTSFSRLYGSATKVVDTANVFANPGSTNNTSNTVTSPTAATDGIAGDFLVYKTGAYKAMLYLNTLGNPTTILATINGLNTSITVTTNEAKLVEFPFWVSSATSAVTILVHPVSDGGSFILNQESVILKATGSAPNLNTKTIQVFAGDSWGAFTGITQRIQAKCPNATLINTSVGGRTAIDLDNAFATEVAPYKPQIVYALVGTNDYANLSYTPALFSYYINRYKSLCASIGAHLVVFTPSVAPENVGWAALDMSRQFANNTRYYDENNGVFIPNNTTTSADGASINISGKITVAAGSTNKVAIGITQAASLAKLAVHDPSNSYSFFATAGSAGNGVGLGAFGNIPAMQGFTVSGAVRNLLLQPGGKRISIGGSAEPDTSALLDMKGVTAGLLIPRMTNIQRNAIPSPATGLLIWSSNDSSLHQYNGLSGWSNYITSATIGANYFPLAGGTLTGTTNTGFVGFHSQTTAMAVPSDGFKLYDSSGFTLLRNDGYRRVLSFSGLTANVKYNFPVGTTNDTVTTNIAPQTLTNKTIVGYARNYVANVLDYGADSTGVSDASTAFTNAIAAAAASSGKTVFVPSGTYLVTNVALTNDIYILGQGTKTVLKPSSGGSSKAIFTATGVNDWAIENIKFSGYNAHAATPTPDSAITNSSINGINISANNQRWRIRNCNFFGFNGFGIMASNVTGLGDSTLGGLVTNSIFRSNYGGAYLGGTVEYNSFVGNEFSANVYGVWNVGGNNKFTSNTFKSSPNGFFLDAGTNDSHGSLVGNDFNHCYVGLKIGAIANGQVIDGNNFYTSSFTCVSSIGLNIINNNFNTNGSTLTFTSTVGTNFSNNLVNGNIGTPPTTSISGNISLTEFNNHYRSGDAYHLSANGALDIAGSVLVTPGAGQALSVTGQAVLSPTTGLNGLIVNQNAATAGLLVQGGTNPWVQVTNSSHNLVLQNAGSVGLVGTTTNIPMSIYANNTQRMKYFTAGTAILQNGGTFTDNGSTLQISGSLSLSYVAKTGTYTAAATDYTIECTSGTFTVTLPTAVGIAGRTYVIVNSGAGTITIGTTSSQTFVNVTATPTTLTMATTGSKMVQSNGVNWMEIGSF